MEGEAIQNAMTGASGTPPSNKEAITGITPHEHNGLNAPTTVARSIATIGLSPIIRFRNFDAPENLSATAKGIVIKR